MDELVTKAMEKWPNVPSAYGWLSLNRQGQWRFHANGDYQANPNGEPIENQQIIQFINRNYLVDEHGQWYFQNGPQRAFVTLPYAPFILRLDDNAKRLISHTEHKIEQVKQWYIDDEGRIFLQTNIGPAMLDGRDTTIFIEQCRLLNKNSQTQEDSGQAFDEMALEKLMKGEALTMTMSDNEQYRANISHMDGSNIEQTLGFKAFPKNAESSPESLQNKS